MPRRSRSIEVLLRRQSHTSPLDYLRRGRKIPPNQAPLLILCLTLIGLVFLSVLIGPPVVRWSALSIAGVQVPIAVQQATCDGPIGKGNSWRVTLTYQYTWRGRDYTGHRCHPAGNTTDRATAEWMVRELSTSSQRRGYICTWYPMLSAVTFDNAFEPPALPIAGFMMLGCGFASLLAWRHIKGQARAMPPT